MPSHERLTPYGVPSGAYRSTPVAVFPLDSRPAGDDGGARPDGPRAVPSHRRAGSTGPGRCWKRLSRRAVTLTVAATVVSGGAAAYLAGAVSTSAPTSLTKTLSPGGSAVLASGTSFADGTGTATFVLPGRPSTDSLYAGVELRSAAGKSLYRAKARIYPSGAVSVDLSKVQDGIDRFLGSKFVPAVVGTGSTTLTVQGRVAGGTQTTLQVRTWLGTTAPAWQYQATDGAGLAAGSVNAWAYLSRRATVPMQVKISGITAAADGSNTQVPTAQPTVPPMGTIAPAPSTTASPAPSTTASPAPTTAATTAPPPPAPSTGAPALDKILANSGASSDTNYPIPAGAVFVAPGGNDGASGSQSAPFGTIAAAVRAAPSGGTVVLRGGLYRQAVGGVGKRLTFQAYPHERPVLTGADVVTGWAQSGTVWYTTAWKSPFGQYDFRAEEIPSGSAAGKVEQAYRNGTALKQVLTKGELAPGRFWVDPSSLRLWIADNPGGATMELSNRSRGMTLYSSAAGSKILGLRFTAYAAPHLDNSGGLYNGASGSLIENSVFDRSSGAGLKISASSTTVQRNTISDNGAEGMQGNRNDWSLVRNNQFLRNNAEHFKTTGCGASCTLAGFKGAHTANMTVRDNAFVGNDSNGVWCDLGCTGTVITGNAVSGGRDGIFYEVSSRGSITNNYVEKAEKGIRVSGSDYVTVSGNTLVDNRSQMTLWDDDRSSSTDAYSAGLGLSWNTTHVVVADNSITGGSRTTKLMDTNATSQVASPQMLSSATGNAVAGSQNIWWCMSQSSCRQYSTVAEWSKVSGLPFVG